MVSRILGNFSETTAAGNTIWGYEIKGLILPVHNIRHICPQELNMVRLVIDMSFTANAALWDGMNDPFLTYGFSMTLFGELEGEKYSLCWHIDKDEAPIQKPHNLQLGQAAFYSPRIQTKTLN